VIIGVEGVFVTEEKSGTSVGEAYESALVPGLFRRWAEVLVAQAGISAGAKVLDVACGTGIATRQAARLCSSVEATGVDIDASMIATARAVSIREGVKADYRIASASELPFESAAFDAALCLQGLQYFPDRLSAMTEMRRVMKRGAKVLVAVWSEIENCKGHWAIVTALERRGIDASAARHPFLLSDRNVLRALADHAGFQNIGIKTMRQLTEFGSAEDFVNAIANGAPSSRHALAQVAASEWRGFLSEVEAALAPWQQGARLAFPMESHVLEARS